jgi:hypothetical protein
MTQVAPACWVDDSSSRALTEATDGWSRSLKLGRRAMPPLFVAVAGQLAQLGDAGYAEDHRHDD